MLIFIPNISYVVDTEIQNQAYSKTKIVSQCQSYIRQVPLYTGIKSGYPSLQFFLRTQKIKRIINITIENHAYFFHLSIGISPMSMWHSSMWEKQVRIICSIICVSYTYTYFKKLKKVKRQLCNQVKSLPKCNLTSYRTNKRLKCIGGM